MTKYSVYKIALLFRDAFRELRKNDPLRMAGATAFFTTFALPPILFILIQVLSLIFDPRTVRTQLFKRLTEIIGKTSTQQITLTLRSFKGLSQNWLINITGFIFLLFVATTLFLIINGSLNQLWKNRVMVKRSIWFSLGNRMRSIFVILIAGVLFMIGLLIEAFQAFMGKYIDEIRPGTAIYFNGVLS